MKELTLESVWTFFFNILIKIVANFIFLFLTYVNFKQCYVHSKEMS